MAEEPLPNHLLATLRASCQGDGLMGTQWGRALLAEIDRLRAAIREHRDQRGDDRCWMDDAALYAALPEGATAFPGPLPPPDEMLANCKRFIELRHCQGDPYVSPQRRIEELEADNARLQALNVSLCDRVAAQSELLSKKAEKQL